MPSSHLILCHPLLLLPPIPPSIRVFSSESTLRMRWPKYWSFSFSIIPSKEIPGLISLRMDCIGPPCSPRDLQESSPTSQFKSINSSVLSLLHSPTHIHTWPMEKTALTRRTFVDKVVSLLLNMLSRLVITFLPRSKHLFISWLQSPSAVILEPPQIKSSTISTVFPSICHEVMGQDAMKWWDRVPWSLFNKCNGRGKIGGTERAMTVWKREREGESRKRWVRIIYMYEVGEVEERICMGIGNYRQEIQSGRPP